LLIGFQVAVLLAVNLALLQDHLVLGKRACFITEYHFNLAELFDQVTICGISVAFGVSVVHEDVFINIESLA